MLVIAASIAASAIVFDVCCVGSCWVLQRVGRCRIDWLFPYCREFHATFDDGGKDSKVSWQQLPYMRKPCALSLHFSAVTDVDVAGCVSIEIFAVS